MKEKDHCQCPVCGEKTIAKKKVKMDGFRPCGEVLVCMLCEAELGTPEEETAPPQSKRSTASALAQLLGGGDDTGDVPLLTPEEKCCFCRDCRYFVAHPFGSRCERYGRKADPMADCPAFEPKRNQFDFPDGLSGN